MGRELTRDGACYRHVIEYIKNDDPHKILKSYHGPYDTPAMAKGMGTRWMGPYFQDSNTLIDRYTEVSKEWQRI